MRATFLGVLVVCQLGCLAGKGPPRPVVGAIRWDAWTGGPVTEQVEKTLGPERYHDRLPWFARVVDETTVSIDGGPQAVMDREILFAADAGLDYWAFLVYPESSSMSTALKQYLVSPERKRINFCLILHNTLNARGEQWPRERARAVALLQESQYQTVLNGRPLVFAFTGAGFPFERFSEFLAAARGAGLNPYYVFMGWNPASDFRKVSDRGFNAVSAYARGGTQGTFSELVDATERHYWLGAAKAKVPCVPLVTTGWDKRPRQDNPVSWEKGHAYHEQRGFPAKATPAEIASHLSRAMAFVRSNPDICRANAIIIYAWNEHDEGGWLSPTLGADGKPDSARLDAIRGVLRERE